MSQVLLIPGLGRSNPTPNPLNPLVLFSAGQPGGWIDPYDLTQMWVDDAGTTPATIASLGTGIGRVVTKGHTPITLVQANAADRPVWGRHPVSGIRNLLTGTAAMSTQSLAVAASQHTLSFQGTGTVTLSGASTAGPLVGIGASSIVSLTFTPTAASLTLTVSGTVELAQLELGAARTTYQSVTNRFDVAEVGSPSLYYFDGNGVNQGWRSASPVDFSGTNKVTVWSWWAIRSAATPREGIELSATSFGTAGTFGLRFEAGGTLLWRSRGTINRFVQSARPADNTRFSVVGVADIAAPLIRVIVDGVVVENTGTQGTGNFILDNLNIFRRNNTGLTVDGRNYGAIIAGDNYDAETIEQFSDYGLTPQALITA
jgi:hypothetical protein